MIKNRKLLEKMEKEQARKTKPDYFKNLRTFEELHKEAIQLGIFPLKNPLEGIEKEIKLARLFNHVQKRNRKNSKSSKKT